ncbi:MAG TPA: CerR family C-terminal domain-containing protein [bacterium]
MDKTAEAPTSQRLLNVAGEVFAERGYHGATVREICRRAGVNLCSVSYHYGSKERLYVTVLRHGAEEALRAYPPDMGLGRGSTPEDALRAYVWSLLHRFLADGRPGWYGRLMARELADPTPALDVIVRDVVRPLNDRLHRIVRSLLRPGTSAEEVELHAMSVIGQCLIYKTQRPILERLHDSGSHTNYDIERLANHIVRASLAAMGRPAARRTRHPAHAGR